MLNLPEQKADDEIRKTAADEKMQDADEDAETPKKDEKTIDDDMNTVSYPI